MKEENGKDTNSKGKGEGDSEKIAFGDEADN
jgi:hypothetical protein